MAAPVEQALGGKYEILQKIREGGMGAIYKVRHRLLDEIRVIKVLKSDLAVDDTVRQRFQNEARFAIQLRHPNIAHLYDFSVSADGKASYIVMEYIDGVTLQELISEHGPPTVGLGCEIATQALRAVGHLHQQGFVHRDIAADNLMLTRDFEGNPLVKLIDLGIAKGKADDVNLTATGIFMGKVRYSPPELFKAKAAAGALDRRSDIYSFGVILYELLTGRSPFDGETFSEIVAGHLFRPPRPFEETDPEGQVPEALRRLCLQALEKDPEERIASTEDLIAGLEAFAPELRAHADELERAITATTHLTARVQAQPAPGSTQDRLDRQFDIRTGTEPAAASGSPRHEPIAHAHQATEILETPQSTKPAAPLGEDEPATLLEDPRELALLRRRLASAARGGDQTPAAGATPGPGPRARPATRSFARSPVGLALGVAVALGMAGVVWGVLHQERPAPRSGSAITVEAAPRWRPPSAARPSSIAMAPEVPDPEPVADPEPPRAPARSTRPSSPPEARRSETPSEVIDRTSQPGQSPEPSPARELPEVRRGELFGPDPGVTPPALVELPPADYPPGFAAPHRELDVLVEVLVHEDGRVLTAKLAPRMSVKKRYRELALDTAKGAVFRPATKHGVEGKMWTTIRVRLPAG